MTSPLPSSRLSNATIPPTGPVPTENPAPQTTDFFAAQSSDPQSLDAILYQIFAPADVRAIADELQNLKAQFNKDFPERKQVEEFLQEISFEKDGPNLSVNLQGYATPQTRKIYAEITASIKEFLTPKLLDVVAKKIEIDSQKRGAQIFRNISLASLITVGIVMATGLFGAFFSVPLTLFSVPALLFLGVLGSQVMLYALQRQTPPPKPPAATSAHFVASILFNWLQTPSTPGQNLQIPDETLFTSGKFLRMLDFLEENFSTNHFTRLPQSVEENFFTHIQCDPSFANKLNLKNKSGKTILMYAASFGWAKSCKYLLLPQPGLIIDQEDPDGNTAFTYAATLGHTDVCTMLAKAEANLKSPLKGQFAHINSIQPHDTEAQEKILMLIDFVYLVQSQQTYSTGVLANAVKEFLDLNDQQFQELIRIAPDEIQKIFPEESEEFKKIFYIAKNFYREYKDNHTSIASSLYYRTIEKSSQESQISFDKEIYQTPLRYMLCGLNYFFTFRGLNLACTELHHLILKENFPFEKSVFNHAKLPGLNPNETNIKEFSFQKAQLSGIPKSESDEEFSAEDSIPTTKTTTSVSSKFKKHSKKTYQGILFGSKNIYPISTPKKIPNTKNLNFPDDSMEKIQLVACIFTNCTMRQINAKELYIQDSIFHDVNLTAAQFEKTTFKNVSFSDCNLNDCIFSETIFTNCEINFKVNSTGISFAAVTIKDTILSGDLRQIDFQGVTFENVKFLHFNFSINNLIEIDFSKISELRGGWDIVSPQEPSNPKRPRKVIQRPYTAEEIEKIFKKTTQKRNIIDFLECIHEKTILTPEEKLQKENPFHINEDTKKSLEKKETFSSVKNFSLIQFLRHLKKQHFKKDVLTENILQYKTELLHIFHHCNAEILAKSKSLPFFEKHITKPFFSDVCHALRYLGLLNEEQIKFANSLKNSGRHPLLLFEGPVTISYQETFENFMKKAALLAKNCVDKKLLTALDPYLNVTDVTKIARGYMRPDGEELSFAQALEILQAYVLPAQANTWS